MRLYRLVVAGRARYVGTQADARAMKRETGAAWSEVDVATDKAGLIAFLNETAPASPVPSLPPVAPPPSPPLPSHALDAGSILSRLDNPTLDLDGIVEAIAAMQGGHALKRIAGAVAMRFEELSRR